MKKLTFITVFLFFSMSLNLFADTLNVTYLERGTETVAKAEVTYTDILGFNGPTTVTDTDNDSDSEYNYTAANFISTSESSAYASGGFFSESSDSTAKQDTRLLYSYNWLLIYGDMSTYESTSSGMLGGGSSYADAVSYADIYFTIDTEYTYDFIYTENEVIYGSSVYLELKNLDTSEYILNSVADSSGILVAGTYRFSFKMDGNAGYRYDSNFDYTTFIKSDASLSFGIEEAQVPLPQTILLLGSGIVGLAGLRRKFYKA